MSCVGCASTIGTKKCPGKGLGYLQPGSFPVSDHPPIRRSCRSRRYGCCAPFLENARPSWVGRSFLGPEFAPFFLGIRNRCNGERLLQLPSHRQSVGHAVPDLFSAIPDCFSLANLWRAKSSRISPCRD